MSHNFKNVSILHYKRSVILVNKRPLGDVICSAFWNSNCRLSRSIMCNKSKGERNANGFSTLHVWYHIFSPNYYYRRLLKIPLTTPIVDSHTPPVKGWRKANLLIGGSPGFCIMRLRLKSINGLLKSMLSSRSAVIVIGASAISLS